MDNLFSLNFAKKNGTYRICEIALPVKIKRRLLDFGFTNGTKVTVLKKSRLGGVFLLELRGFVLSLKQSEVCGIMVREQ